MSFVGYVEAIPYDSTELSRSGNLPKLALSAHPSIVTSYSDLLKQKAFVTLIQELEAKQCITRMAPGEEGYFSRLLEGLSRPQKVRWVPIGDRSVSTEQRVSTDTVQHGQIISSETSVEAGNVGNGTLAVHGSSQTGKDVGVEKNFALFQYLDDWLNLDLDKGRLHASTQRLVTTCQGLGLLVNIQK